MLAWPSATVNLSSVFSVKQNESTLKFQNDSKQNLILKKKVFQSFHVFFTLLRSNYLTLLMFAMQEIHS